MIIKNIEVFQFQNFVRKNLILLEKEKLVNNKEIFNHYILFLKRLFQDLISLIKVFRLKKHLIFLNIQNKFRRKFFKKKNN